MADLGNLGVARSLSDWFSAYNSSSRRLASSAAEMDRTLPATNTRCRKLSTSGALSARSSRHAGLLSRSHAISSTLGTTDIVGRHTDTLPVRSTARRRFARCVCRPRGGSTGPDFLVSK